MFEILEITVWGVGGTLIFADELKPGTPAADDFAVIAAKLKEIEAERQRERQATEEKK